MNCHVAHERIVTAAYGELADEQTHELERHVEDCAECLKEREQLLALKVLADAHPVAEPDANLMARSRLKLEEALDALPPLRWFERLGQRLRNNFANMQAAPVAACLLLAVGAGAGSLGGYRVAENRAAHTLSAQAAVQPAAATTAETAAPAEIASISSIVRQPNSHMVEVRYNQVVPQQIEGSLDDPAIRQLLMLASENSTSAGVRDDSVGLMAAECRAGHACKGEGIRDALMVALRYDKNAGVREKAHAWAGAVCGRGYAGAGCDAGGAFERQRPEDSHRGDQHSGAGGGRYERAAGAEFGCQFGPESLYPHCFERGFEPGSGDSISGDHVPGTASSEENAGRIRVLVSHPSRKKQERGEDGAPREVAGEETMKHFLRPYRRFAIVAMLGAGAWLAMAPAEARSQARGTVQWFEEPSPLALHSSSQGYLGVDLADVDQEKAQALKLKEVRGAIITLIDHDAPAGQIGLKVNDVVLELNGQAVEGAEQLRRMLREIPAGRKVSLEISRDGNLQTLAVQLADRRVMEHEVWTRIGTERRCLCAEFRDGHSGWRRRRAAAGRLSYAVLRQQPEGGRAGGAADLADGRVPGRAQRSDGQAGGAQERGRYGRSEGLRRDSQGGLRHHRARWRIGSARCTPTRARRCR